MCVVLPVIDVHNGKSDAVDCRRHQGSRLDQGTRRQEGAQESQKETGECDSLLTRGHPYQLPDYNSDSYVDAALSFVLFMSLYSLHVLTTLVFACFIVFLLFCASAVYFLCSGVRLSHLSDKSFLT